MSELPTADPKLHRSRWRIVRVSTWFPGFQTTRTFVAPWMWETMVFIIPGFGVGFQWGWHCDECREKYG